MTMPRYQHGCAAGSEESGNASSPSDYAIYVNFNNGNVNWNNQSNNGFVRACRLVPASECRGAQRVELTDLIRAKRSARRRKKPSHNAAAFEARWIDGLLDVQEAINAGTWSPNPTTCFVAGGEKVREIHAPDFSDRVVHHWLVPQLEAIYGPLFIHDSFANQRGKGTHAAVGRLKAFVRQVHSGQGGGYFLQLDIHNFFVSIHRPTLWALLKNRMVRAGVPEIAQRVAHALIRQSPKEQRINYRATAAERAEIPPHKRMENAAPGCGLAIGNLSSQLFANIYLHELDLFVKHELKAQRYVRYVDDFVLVHHSREQLVQWQQRIEQFLAERLRLRLKPEIKLQPLTAGIDFLGYVIHPTHTLVRQRVISHAREKLWQWQQNHVSAGEIRATPEQYQTVAAIWASYVGHMRHANSFRLRADFERRYPFLRALAVRRRFDHRLDGQQLSIPFASRSTS